MVFPKLPVLESVFPKSSFREETKDIALVCVQHLLETTGSLLEKCIEFGFRPQNIHVLGKLYSTNDLVRDKVQGLGVRVYPTADHFPWGEYGYRLGLDISSMWNRVLQDPNRHRFSKVIVLDDGGASIAAVPLDLARKVRVLGVEQTMSGITLNQVVIEPTIIREAVFSRITRIMDIKTMGTVGVVGTGYIGAAIARGLLTLGSEVVVYDQDSDKAADFPVSCETLSELYDRSDTIIGCTGNDHLFRQEWLHDLTGVKTLISCSSKDIEFRTLLLTLNDRSEFEFVDRRRDVSFEAGRTRFVVLRGGFPVNFDGTAESVPGCDIQLTRALLFGAILQASAERSDIEAGTCVELSPHLQMNIVKAWFECNPLIRRLYAPSIDTDFRRILFGSTDGKLIPLTMDAKMAC
jgi:S-adenosylhomocysteine hydrolase